MEKKLIKIHCVTKDDDDSLATICGADVSTNASYEPDWATLEERLPEGYEMCPDCVKEYEKRQDLRDKELERSGVNKKHVIGKP